MKLRTTAKLPESIERRLLSYCISAAATESVERRLVSYCISAAATGFGALALSQPADARIVYTAVHVSMFPPGSHTNYYCIDFDHKGVTDVCLSRGAELYNTWLGAYPNSPSGDAVAISAGGRGAVAVRYGAKIGASRHFLANEFRVNLADGATSKTLIPKWYGQWANGGKGLKHRYLGIKFRGVYGHFHYGWARITVTIDNPKVNQINRALLTGYAYETIPGKAIIAGKTKGPDEDNSIETPNASLTAPTHTPATLGMLALGAPALSIWRREESVHGSLKRSISN